jgi:hypothetical protein
MGEKTSIAEKRWVVVGSIVGVVAVSVAFLVYNYSLSTSCEGIFQQTKLNLASSIEMLQVKGEIGFSNDKIQDLTEKAQLVALNYKACCVAADNDLMPHDKFLECKNATEAYGAKLRLAAQHVVNAREAEEDGNRDEVKQRTEDAEKALRESTRLTSTLPKSSFGTTVTTDSASYVASAAAEKEPNDDLFSGSEIAIGSTVSGNVQKHDDVDVYRVANSSDLRDWVQVKMKNK